MNSEICAPKIDIFFFLLTSIYSANSQKKIMNGVMTVARRNETEIHGPLGQTTVRCLR